MPDYETILVERENRVLTITLNRPEKLNAYNQKMKEELRAAWIEVRDDADIWCSIITGAGRAFCSGADVSALKDKGFRKTDRFRELAMIETIRDLPTPRRMGVMKPVIAAVNGICNGNLLDLVTESDIPIAAASAQFMDSHVSLGFVSSHEVVNLARRIPVAAAMRMALLGAKERMSAERAYELGLVTEVVADEELMPRARELAGLICENAPIAVWATKLGIVRGLGLPIEQAEEIAAGYLEIGEQTEDHAEGPRAWAEGRKPDWQGR
ncbi:MAG: enoyl-CoA hydratase/isomerase family protein [bacterium]